MSSPTIIIYQLATADGRVALSPDVLLMNDQRWPHYDGGGYSAVMARYHPDALLEGSGTLVLPDAEPLVFDPSELAHDTHHGHFLPQEVLDRTTRWFAVVDSRGRVKWEFKEFPYPEWVGTHLLVLVSQTTNEDYLRFLRRELIPYLVVGTDHVDLRLAADTMSDLLSVETVVATCGGHLSGVLLKENLVDQVTIEIIPLLAGGTTTPALFHSADLAPDESPTSLRLLDSQVFDDGRVILSYRATPEQ